jgi:hypothetical protein
LVVSLQVNFEFSLDLYRETDGGADTQNGVSGAAKDARNLCIYLSLWAVFFTFILYYVLETDIQKIVLNFHMAILTTIGALIVLWIQSRSSHNQD